MVFYDFPIITDEYKLPLCLISVGLNDWQYHATRKEGYPNHQIIYCTRGSGTLILDGKEYLITPNMGFFLPKDYPHEYYSNGAVWDTHWVSITGFAAKDTLKLFGLEKPKVFTLPETKELERHFRHMHEAVTGDKFYGVYKASGILYSFLIEFNRLMNKNRANSLAVSPILVKAVDYINEHYRDKITLDTLCEVCGVTKQYLCRLFRDELSVRPMEYIAKRKVQASRELLHDPNKSIDDIAEELGFCSGSYFNKVFKRCEGITAAKFRKI